MTQLARRPTRLRQPLLVRESGQRFEQLGAQSVGFVWFLDEACESFARETVYQILLVVSARKHHGDVFSNAAKLSEALLSVHVRHCEV